MKDFHRPLGSDLPLLTYDLHMTRSRVGSARQAAEVLGRSTSQFNTLRERSTLEYDPLTGISRPLLDEGARRELYAQEVGDPSAVRGRRDVVLEHYLRTRYLVCPALFGWKLPGGTWTFNLTALERLLREGPPGAAA